MRRLSCELIRFKAFKKVVRFQFREQLPGLGLDMLGITKRVALLRYTHGAHLARPSIDVLKQVMVDGAIVLKIKLTFGQWLTRSRVGDFGLVSVQIALIAQIELVYENR